MGAIHTSPHRLLTLLALTICASILTSCLVRPYDGQRVSSRSAPIEFGGFVLLPSTEVRVLAWNRGSGRYDVIGRATSGTRAYPQYGSNWYRWDTTLEVAAVYWEPGARGASVKLRTEFNDSRGRASGLTSLAEDPLDCDPTREDDLSNILLKCSAQSNPALVLCTEDYEPAGNRRGECTRRMVKLSSAAVSFDDRLFPAATTMSRLGGRSEINYVKLRADRTSFLDVYQRRLDSDDPAERARLHTHGIVYSKFIRLYYPEPNISERMSTFNLRRLGEGFGRLYPGWTDPRAGWDTGRSVRFYDRGECSVSISWQDLLQLISVSLETKVARRAEELDLPILTLSGVPDSNAVLDPILRTGTAGDAFHFAQSFNLSAGLTLRARVLFTFTAAFSVEAGILKLNIEHLELRPSSEGALLRVLVGKSLPRFLSELSPIIEDEIETTFNTALNRLGMRVGGVARVYGRPEGFEIVLADRVADLSFGPLSVACPVLCNRSPRTSAPTFIGYFDTIFDPPPTGPRPFIVENDLPLLKISGVDRSPTSVRVAVGGTSMCAFTF